MLREVKDNSWIHAEDLSKDESNEDWNETCWTVLRGALERVDKISENPKKYEPMINYLEGSDVLYLLFSKGFFFRENILYSLSTLCRKF